MWTIIAILMISIHSSGSFQYDRQKALREKMVDRQIEARGISDSNVLAAMRKVPRHLFVPENLRDDAYGDYPLPIGRGQTISQPYIVAFMTEAVRPAKMKKVLEIGTGSGYQAAVLAEIVDSVFTIEIVSELAGEADARLKKLGYSNVVVRAGDGYFGWEEKAPFDIIIVTAAAESVPEPLTAQLAENGRLVIPVGGQGEVQELVLITKKKGSISERRLTSVRFVPFTRSGRKQ